MLLSLELSASASRLGLWFRCLRSEVGHEPDEPYLRDPASQRLVPRNPTSPYEPLGKKEGNGKAAAPVAAKER